MRLTIPIIVALLLFAGLAQAADVPTEKGDKAMVFMFHGLDDLGLGAYGGGFGMRYYFADYMAIRGGIVFDSYSETCEPASTDSVGWADEEWSSTDIGVELVFEKHLEGCGPSVSPYVGVGGGFHKTSSEKKDPTFYYEQGERVYGVNVTTEDGTALEVFGVAGFEWAFTDCMTLGGEYVLGFESWSGEKETDYADPDHHNWKRNECSGTWIGFGTASVYLSVYW